MSKALRIRSRAGFCFLVLGLTRVLLPLLGCQDVDLLDAGRLVQEVSGDLLQSLRDLTREVRSAALLVEEGVEDPELGLGDPVGVPAHGAALASHRGQGSV